MMFEKLVANAPSTMSEAGPATALVNASPPLAAFTVAIATPPKLRTLVKVCVSASLLVTPPAPMLSVVPPMLNAPAVLLKVTLFVLKGTLTFGVSRAVPAKMRSVSAMSLAGAVLSSQLKLLARLLSAPPPSQVSVTAKARAVRRRAMVVVRMRGFMAVES